MVYDFDVSTLEKSKELIIGYKNTKDKKIFERLIFIFDDYVKYLIFLFKKKYYCLKGETFWDLYSISIIGLEDSFCKFHDDWRTDKILLWIGSYIKYHLLKEFDYKKKERYLDEVDFDCSEQLNSGVNREGSDTRFDDFLNKLNIKDVLNSKILTAEEVKFVRMKYFDDISSIEIAKRLRVSAGYVSQMNKKICDKIGKLILEEDK